MRMFRDWHWLDILFVSLVLPCGCFPPGGDSVYMFMLSIFGGKPFGFL